MSVILYLLGASLILGGGGLAIFLWSLQMANVWLMNILTYSAKNLVINL